MSVGMALALVGAAIVGPDHVVVASEFIKAARQGNAPSDVKVYLNADRSQRTLAPAELASLLVSCRTPYLWSKTVLERDGTAVPDEAYAESKLSCTGEFARYTDGRVIVVVRFDKVDRLVIQVDGFASARTGPVEREGSPS